MNKEIEPNNESKTHYVDKTGRMFIIDEIQYFEDMIRSTETYSVSFYLGKHQSILSKKLVHADGSVSSELTSEQGSNLWSHILEKQQELESLTGRPLVIREPDPHVFGSMGEGYIRITRKSRVSADILIKQNSIQKEAYDFLEAAYSAGLNIIIEGQTGSGKTLLLNTLMDSAKDYKDTILIHSLPEMKFGFDHREITEIRSDDPASIIYQARRMDPSRMVLDDVLMDEKGMAGLVTSALTGMQIVATGYTTPSAESSPDIDHLSSVHIEHPYELRVYVSLDWNDGNTKRAFKVLSIKQIVHQKTRGYDTTFNRVLFDSERKVAEPTRTLRRKMEGAKRTTSVSNPTYTETATNALVSVTSEEKAQLEDNRKALREHFTTQNFELREKFEEIDRILAKF